MSKDSEEWNKPVEAFTWKAMLIRNHRGGEDFWWGLSMGTMSGKAGSDPSTCECVVNKNTSLAEAPDTTKFRKIQGAICREPGACILHNFEAIYGFEGTLNGNSYNCIFQGT